jgi:hypothetical protein
MATQTLQSLQRRVACPRPSIPTNTSHPHAMVLPRLWPNLSAATQKQIAGTLAELMRRIRPRHGGPGREIGCADRPERH